MKLWSKRIYADAAAATPISKSAAREMKRVSKLFGNPSALHKEAVAAKKELDSARASVASSLGAHADEIVFTGSGTEANNLAIFGVLRGALGAHAVTTAIEHSSVLEPLRALEREGLELTILPVDEAGMVDPKSLREAIKENTVFVSVQMVNSEIGTIQNIREIAKEVRHVRKEKLQKFASNGAGGKFLNSSLLLHTDASQAPLWLPLNVEKLGVDLLTIDAQKMLGPKGVGALFVRRLAAGSQAALTLAPLIYGGGQERGRRSGTENVAHAAALAVALREAQLDVEARAATITDIRDFLISEIQKIIPRAQLNGAEGAARVANNINISIKGLNGDLAVVALDARGIAASTRSACDTDDESPSHVLKAIGKTPEEAKNSLRITLLPDATIGQATRILEALKAVTSRYRQQL